MSKYTIFFEKYINRPLKKWELDVIAALEYIRQHGDNHRLVIVDPPGYDSRKLLCEYYQYLHHRIDHYGNFLVMAKTKRDAASISGNLSRPKNPWLTTASGNHPEIQHSTFKIRESAKRCSTDNSQPRQKQLHHHPHTQRIS